MKRNKDNTNNTNIPNGITITDSISLNINSKYWINSKLLLIITAIAGVIGFTVSFLTLFDFSVSYKMIFAAETVIFMVCAVIFMFPSKAKLLLIPVYILIGYAIYRYRISVSYGYAKFINIIAVKLRITAEGHDYYHIKDNVNTEECLTLFLIFFFVIITTIICYNTIIKPRFLFVFSCTFPFIETGLYFGFSPDHIAFSLLISYWLAVFAMRTAGNQFHSSSGQPVFVRRRNIFVSSGNLRNNVIEDIGIITLISVFAVFIISSAALSIFKYERPEKVNNARYNVKTAISEMSIEKLMESMNDPDKNPITDKSRLGNLSKISFNNRTDLSIILSEKLETNLYLKGFVGSEYRNNSWYTIPDSIVSENSEVFSIFEKNNIYPQEFNEINDNIIANNYPDDIRSVHMIVKSMFNTNSYIFAPYSTILTDDITPVKDSVLKSEDMKDYSYTFLSTPEYYKNMQPVYESRNTFSENQKFSETESAYREFVYKNYLTLPESTDIEYLKNTYSSIPKYDGSNITEISSQIKRILHSSAEYTLEPGRTPSNMELTYYLLTQNHKGYCSHFATAAAVLARISGVPSRYAEGYVVIPEDFENAENINTYYKINVNDSRAHAWAEFYIDGYGWLPFEFTPGYDYGVITAEEPSNSDETQTKVSKVTKTVAETTYIGLPVAAETSSAVTSAPENPGESNITETGESTVSGVTVETPGNGKPKTLKILINVLKAAASILLTVFFIFTVIFARHIFFIRKRLMSFRCKSPNKSISNVYKYILQLLKHNGISAGNMLPLDFAEYAEENAGEIFESGEISEVVRLTLKSSFSNIEATKDELKYAVAVANKIAKNIYSQKTKYEKFVFKYLLNLIK